MTLFEQLVQEYHPQDNIQLTAVQREVMQKVALAGLARGGFFERAAFYGGTCLRLMHGLPRYSEDMDFSLIEKTDTVHLEDYFQSIIDEFTTLGMAVEIEKKDKKIFGRVESAFLKENTEAYDIKFQTRKMMKVKIEMDIDPPLLFQTEQRVLDRPYVFPVRCIALPDLFAGKLNALVYRAWQTRIKGRDWYDFAWYVRNNVPLNWIHLQERIREFTGEIITPKQFTEMLLDKLANSNIEMVKKDVVGFVDNPRELDFWTNDYFLNLATKINWIE